MSPSSSRVTNKSFLQVWREHFYLPTGNWHSLLPLKGSSERDCCNAAFRWRKLFWEVKHCERKRKEERKKEKEREGGMPASVMYKYVRKVKVTLKLMLSKLVYVRRAVFQR